MLDATPAAGEGGAAAGAGIPGAGAAGKGAAGRPPGWRPAGGGGGEWRVGGGWDAAGMDDARPTQGGKCPRKAGAGGESGSVSLGGAGGEGGSVSLGGASGEGGSVSLGGASGEGGRASPGGSEVIIPDKIKAALLSAMRPVFVFQHKYAEPRQEITNTFVDEVLKISQFTIQFTI